MKIIYTFLFIFLFWNYVQNKSVPYIGNPIVENCVACKYIWENIEEALVDSNSSFLESDSRRNPILAAQAFQYFCRIAPDIFFEPCNIMFEKLFSVDFSSKNNILLQIVATRDKQAFFDRYLNVGCELKNMDKIFLCLESLILKNDVVL